MLSHLFACIYGIRGFEIRWLLSRCSSGVHSVPGIKLPTGFVAGGICPPTGKGIVASGFMATEGAEFESDMARTSWFKMSNHSGIRLLGAWFGYSEILNSNINTGRVSELQTTILPRATTWH